MDIFENLVEELKEENLLERTVTEKNGSKTNPDSQQSKAETNSVEEALETEIAAEPAILKNEIAALPPPNPVNEREFYRKRATDEVMALQMVEHVFTGVEREHMKVIPKAFDDLEVKKSLHAFLQLEREAASQEHAQAEFQLMQETESWFSSLSQRDKSITVSNLRRYCEQTRPALSSQALLALARFYRNSPYSEFVRSKFDLIITRFFSKDTRNEKRLMSFSREEVISQLNRLYAEWSSISLYSTDEDDSTILLTVLKFEDFISEADSADNFDELIKNDFFNRLRAFKESTNENFFAPMVAATAIESNIRIGNRYVELLEAEREKLKIEQLEKKYGFLHDQVISDTTGKSLQLLKLVNEKNREKPHGEIPEKTEIKPTPTPKKLPEKASEKKSAPVNKWVIIFSLAGLIFCGVFYFWTENSAADAHPSEVAKRVNLENSFLKEQLSAASINNGLFLGITETSWSQLSRDNKENFVRKIIAAGKERNYDKVQLVNKKGEKVAYGDKNMVEIYD